MRKALSILLILLIVSAATPLLAQTQQTDAQTQQQSQASQSPLTNKDVLDMVKAGLASEVIVAKIKASASNSFDTSTAALQELKTAGVSDAVILAMVQAGSSTNAAAADAPSVDVKVVDGTEIEIQLKNNVSGQEAKVGDIVDFTVVRPVVIGGVTVIDKDAPARARITTAKKAGYWGKAGKLEWAMQDVQAVDGTRIPVRFTKRQTGDSKGGTVAVAAVATTVLLGPVGLLWGLKKGKAAIIPAGNRYSIFVQGDMNVKGRSNPTPTAATATQQ